MLFFSKFWNFLKKTLDIELNGAFGLDISDRSMELMEIRVFWRPRIVTYGRIALAPGIIENGKIKNSGEFAAGIMKLLSLAQPRKVSTNKVVISLPESNIFIHNFETPTNEKAENLEDLILREASSVIPLTPRDSYYDWQIKTLSIRRDGKLILHTLYAAVKKETAEEYIRILSELGLEPIIMDIEPASLGRIFLEKKNYPQIIIDIGADASTINVFNIQRALILSADIPVAGEEFTRLIAAARNIQPAEAEELKRTDPDILKLVEPATAKIIAEIKKIIKYCEDKQWVSAQKIILTGGSALLPGLADYFSKQMNLPVEIGNLFKRVAIAGQDAQFFSSALFGNVIGLALRGASKSSSGINLLKRVPREKFQVDSLILKLMSSGHLKKSTLIRSILNNYIFVIPLFIIAVILLAIMAYWYIYRPFTIGL